MRSSSTNKSSLIVLITFLNSMPPVPVSAVLITLSVVNNSVSIVILSCEEFPLHSNSLNFIVPSSNATRTQ